MESICVLRTFHLASLYILGRLAAILGGI